MAGKPKKSAVQAGPRPVKYVLCIHFIFHYATAAERNHPPRFNAAQPGARGTLRPAVTDWERIASGEYNGEIFSYLKLIPKTGRTHQLRVHLKANDRPIVQDPLYSGKLRLQSNNLGLTRLALHAHVLEIELPSGQHERFIAQVPFEFEQAAERLSEERAAE